MKPLLKPEDVTQEMLDCVADFTRYIRDSDSIEFQRQTIAFIANLPEVRAAFLDELHAAVQPIQEDYAPSERLAIAMFVHDLIKRLSEDKSDG